MPALTGAVASAPGGAVICVAPGSYTGMKLGGAHSSDVTVQPESMLDPTAAGKVTIALSSSVSDGFGNLVAAEVDPNSSHIAVQDLYFTNELSIGFGSSAITVEHDDFTQVGNGGGEMINFATSNCKAPNAPSWANCSPLAPVSNVTITGNDFHGINSQGDDVLHTNNFRNLLVTGNEISGAVENNAGGHVDCLQNVFGGSGLTFSYNYEHDNECQGFFLKDGDITNVAFNENLFVRDTVPATNGGSSYSSTQIWNASGVTAENNTIWDGKGMTLRCIGATVPCTATIDHNVMSTLNNGNRGDANLFAMSEADNLFQSGATFSSSDRVQPHPAFACGSRCDDGSIAGDDHRLLGNPGGVGVSWAPSQFVYGPGG
jgi:hypothetical protein